MGAVDPGVGDLLPWTCPGVSPGRSWVRAPLAGTLRRRWDRLVAAPAAERAELLVPTRRRRGGELVAPLPGGAVPTGALTRTGDPCPDPVRLARRPLDRQWLLADARVLDAARPELWRARGERQVFATVLPDGAVVCSAALPDAEGHGRGSVVAPLYRDPAGREPNVAPGLAEFLAATLGLPVTDEDVFAWVVAVAGGDGGDGGDGGGKADRGEGGDGPVVPLTADPRVWRAGVAAGRRLVWLHTFGARWADPVAGRAAGRPRLPGGRRPYVRQAVPGTRAGVPEEITHDAGACVLGVGEGRIAPVPAAVWEYTIAGAPVVRAWFGERAPATGAAGLAAVTPRTWPPELTTELLDLLNVVGLLTGAAREAARVRTAALAGPRPDTATLRAAGVLPVPARARRPVTVLDAGEEGPGGQRVLV